MCRDPGGGTFPAMTPALTTRALSRLRPLAAFPAAALLGVTTLAGTAQATAAAAPAAPRSVTAATAAGTLTVRWQAPPAGAAVTGYSVTCTSTDGGVPRSGTAGPAARSLVLSGLPDNRTYSCGVTAKGAGGTSAAARSPYVEHARLSGGGTATGHVPVKAGQSVSVVVPATSFRACAATVSTTDPKRFPIGTACLAPAAFVDGARVGGAGTATTTVEGRAGSTGTTGTAELVIHVYSDVTGTIAPGGAAVSPRTTSPGQNARYSFSGSAGQGFTVKVTGSTFLGLTRGTFVEIVRADGAELGEVFLTTASGTLSRVVLPSTGTYGVVLDPRGTATGTATLALVRS